MKEVTLLDLLKNGVHFGHQKSRRHPKMEPHIFTVRNGVHIINLEKTLEKLIEALAFIKKTAQEGGQILFLGTKRQAKDIIKKHAQSCGMPYLTERWMGGLFTNFTNVSKLQKKLKKLEEERQSGELEKYTKKERSKFEKEIEKLDRLVGGIKDMRSLPNAIFVVDIREEKTAIQEASKKKVPIVAMVDTNTNPDPISYVIPANDDATKSIEYITGLVAEAVNEGKMLRKQNQSENANNKETVNL
ncbi:MAG: 30S ribosomal protein S2 [Candidatus Kerfeldbacteria bacterium CG_4_10_14_0_8_um_filter_42_10]|uniref:Small ribosomal subunit protein uS2 n=1 Tax=Candidatus Kerfeldbacteria bacterium CG_4_10_14_0_8_um_filter_42_10 TaxID=2014248 RepID=A0A2M7RJZ3_9BACT|nr:MAG: 30S ribosomal protein S2 [Candidatus Kerfeldbacteria bacterium CG_4_10_14_0_8_um_filter_42_10]